MRANAAGLILGLVVFAACSSGSGGESETASLAKGLEGMKVIPGTLGERVCDEVQAFNNRSEVILSCRPGGDDVFSYGAISYALWTGGDTLEELSAVRKLPPLGPQETFFISGFSDDGAVFGTIGDFEDSADSSTFTPTRGFRADPDRFFEYPDRIDAVSNNGEHVLTAKFIELSAEEFRVETTVYRNQTPVTLAPFPTGVSDLVPPAQIRNDGAVGGTALIGEPGQTFAPGYGYFRSQKSFDLIAPPGRAELANVYGIAINNTGSAVLFITSNTSYTLSDPEGNQYTQQVIAAAFVGKDGNPLAIAYEGNPNVDIYAAGINDREIVYGSYNTQTSPDQTPRGDFIFSPRSGFRKLEEIVPGADAGYLLRINNANRALISTAEGIVMVELPGGL